MNRSFLLENLSDMLDEVDARLTDLISEVHRLEMDVYHAKEDLAESEAENERLTALEARPQAPDYWRKWASSEVEIKTAELDAARCERDNLDAERKRLDAENAMLAADIDDLTRQCDNLGIALDKAAADVNRLKAEITACTAERDAAWQENDELAAQRNALADEVNDLKKDNARLTDRVSRLEAAIKNKNDLIAALRQNSADLQANK